MSQVAPIGPHFHHIRLARAVLRQVCSRTICFCRREQVLLPDPRRNRGGASPVTELLPTPSALDAPGGCGGGQRGSRFSQFLHFLFLLHPKPPRSDSSSLSFTERKACLFPVSDICLALSCNIYPPPPPPLFLSFSLPPPVLSPVIISCIVDS